MAAAFRNLPVRFERYRCCMKLEAAGLDVKNCFCINFVKFYIKNSKDLLYFSYLLMQLKYELNCFLFIAKVIKYLFGILYIDQIRGRLLAIAQIPVRQADHTCLSRSMAGSTCPARTRTTTTRGLGLVAPAGRSEP